MRDCCLGRASEVPVGSRHVYFAGLLAQPQEKAPDPSLDQGLSLGVSRLLAQPRPEQGNGFGYRSASNGCESAEGGD